MNSALRSEDSIEWTKQKALIYAAASGLNKLKSDKSRTCAGKIVFRGEQYKVTRPGQSEIPGDEESIPFEVLNMGSTKEPLIERSFLSTTSCPNRAKTFSFFKQAAFFEISCLTGVDISDVSFWPEEQEFLFIPGTRFENAKNKGRASDSDPLVIQMDEAENQSP